IVVSGRRERTAGERAREAVLERRSVHARGGARALRIARGSATARRPVRVPIACDVGARSATTASRSEGHRESARRESVAGLLGHASPAGCRARLDGSVDPCCPHCGKNSDCIRGPPSTMARRPGHCRIRCAIASFASIGPHSRSLRAGILVLLWFLLCLFVLFFFFLLFVVLWWFLLFFL